MLSQRSPPHVGLDRAQPDSIAQRCNPSPSPAPDEGPERSSDGAPDNAPQGTPKDASKGASKSGAERRRHERARADWPITVVLDDGVHEAKIRDVSRGGVCFFLDRPVPEMTTLKIEFDIPVDGGVRRIRGDGAVVRCERIARNLEHYEIAVFMQDMALPDRDTVERYVRRRQA